MTIGGTARYSCPLPNCGWERDTPPDEGPMVVELALREHANEHSVLEYLRALIGAQAELARATALTAAQQQVIERVAREALASATPEQARRPRRQPPVPDDVYEEDR